MSNNQQNVTWKWIVGVAAALMLLGVTTFSSITGWLVSKGVESLQESDKQFAEQMKEFRKEYKERCSESDRRQERIEKRMDRIEILVTMPYDKRIEALKSLGNMNIQEYPR